MRHLVDTLTHTRDGEPVAFSVRATDGVRISGVHHVRPGAPVAVIYAHGLLSGTNHLIIPRFLSRLAASFGVIAFDFRGHGESGGRCSFYDGELLDLDAVVGYARRCGYRHVVLVGSSMGGAAAIRYAGMIGGMSGVATIGAFADARNLGRRGSSVGLRLLFNTRLGGHFARLLGGARLGILHIDRDHPIDVVDRIAPAPLLLVHGQWDWLIHPSEAQRLYDRAREPRELVIVPRTSHDLPLLTGRTVALLEAWIAREVLHRTRQIPVAGRSLTQPSLRTAIEFS